MIRITYLDRTYLLHPEDDANAPVTFTPRDVTSWVAVMAQGAFKIEVLSGGTKTPRAVL